MFCLAYNLNFFLKTNKENPDVAFIGFPPIEPAIIFSKWSVKNDTIYYDTTSVAYYDHSEYELNPNHGMRTKIIQELSITQINFDVTTDELIKYVHKKHKKQKVEIVVPRH